jgi:hypothetical protein
MATCFLVGAKRVQRHPDITCPPMENGEDYEYYLNILRWLIHEHGCKGERFYIVHDSTKPMPDLDEKSVVLLSGDERCLLPVEAERAFAILKCFGTYPRFNEPLRPNLYTLVDLTRHLRERLRWHLAAWRLGPQRTSKLMAKTIPIPLGYSTQRPLPLLPLETRPYLVFFAGSLDNHPARPFSYTALANYPKRQARLAMLKALKRLEHELAPGAVCRWTTENYDASLASGWEDYFKTLMHTRICLCPRGSRMETFRIHEAMRYGCIVISQRLPDEWYLRGCPAVVLDNWNELPAVVHDLLADSSRMQDLHRRSLDWWQTVTSPAAVARHVASKLAALTAKKHAIASLSACRAVDSA